MKKGPGDTLRWLRRGIFRAFYFFFFAWGDVDDGGRVLVIRRVILYFGEKMTMIRWGKRLLEELVRDGSAILFVDEFHTIVGAGAAEGAIDAASILKPVLARGELQLIGATTNQEFRTHIQKDAALERRFGRVQIEEPTPKQAVDILEGLAPRYERYHGVRLPNEALREAVELSVRYLPGRCLPDKAIDLVDEACAAVRIRAEREGEKDPVLSRKEIARVVAQASGVPAERVGEKERERLARLEERLNAEVVGQSRAVAAVAGAIRRSRTGLTFLK